MAFCCLTYEKNKEVALITFAKEFEKMISSCKKGEMYFFLPKYISKDLEISLFDVLKIVGMNIDSNSSEIVPLSRIYSNSKLLSDCIKPTIAPHNEDIVVAPFFEPNDYVFLKNTEKESKCNIVCLAKLDEDLKNLKFDKVLNLNNNTSAKALLVKALQENKTFEEFLQIFKEHLHSCQMPEEEQKEQMERALNVKYYFE